MKLFSVFSSLLVVISALSEEQAWAGYKQTHSKVYKNLREDKLRFEIFKSHLQQINEHNSRFNRGEESYSMGINQFTDLTSEEFKQTYLGYKKPKIEINGIFEPPNNFSAAASMDWRSKGAVLSVRNQGQCGSCWAFSAVGALEGQNAIKHSRKIELSEQELVDCSGTFGNEGCNGGLMDDSFKYVQANGIAARSAYPYVASKRACSKASHARADIKVTGHKGVGTSESALQAAVASVGPISVAVDADKFQHYSSGVFDVANCGKKLDHAVLVVGYGSAGGKDFWLVKNSWGGSWGESGYIKMSRNKNNQCGIASEASYPVLG